MGKQVWALAVVSAIVLTIAGYIAYAVTREPRTFGHTPSNMTSTMSSAKQLSLALIMYQADYDDRMPPRMDDPAFVEKVIFPYTQNRLLWISHNPTGSRLSVNPGLSFVPATGLEDPETTVAVFDSLDWPGGRRPVAYTDGHAKIVAGFDANSSLFVRLTQAGKEQVEKSKADASRPQPFQQKSEHPLGMP